MQVSYIRVAFRFTRQNSRICNDTVSESLAAWFGCFDGVHVSTEGRATRREMPPGCREDPDFGIAGGASQVGISLRRKNPK